MTTCRRNQKGFSIIEAFLAVTLGILVILGVAAAFQNTWVFLQTGFLRHQMQVDARRTLDAIMLWMRNGKPSTLGIDTPTGGVAYSSSTFNTQDGNQITIY